MTAPTCPAWCTRKHEPDDLQPPVHSRDGGRDGDVSVSLLQSETWDKPQVYIGHYGLDYDRPASVLLPLREAADMAALLTRLGHAELAALITKAADGAR